MPQDTAEQQRGEHQAEDGEYPHESGEGHGAEGEDLRRVIAVQRLHVIPELCKHALGVAVRVLHQVLELEHGYKGKCVDNHARAFGDENPQPSLERKVCEQRDVVIKPATRRQLRKHQKPLPARIPTALPAADAVVPHGNDIQVCLGDAVGFNDTDGKEPVEAQEDEGEEDTGAEDDAGNFKVDEALLLEFIGPAALREEDCCSVDVGSIAGEGDDGAEVDTGVGEGVPPGGGFKVGEILRWLARERGE